MNSGILNIIVSGVGGQGTVLAGKLLATCALAGGAFVRSAETIGMSQRGGSVLGHVRILQSTCNNQQGKHGASSQEYAAAKGQQGDSPNKSLRKAPSNLNSCSNEAAVASSPLASPLIPKGQAQLLIGFEPAEALRAYSFCGPKSLVVTATDPLPPPTASLQKLHYDGKAQLAALEQEAELGRIATLVVVDNTAVMTKLGFDKALNVILLGAALAALENSEFNCSVLSYAAMQQTIEDTVKQRFVEPNLRALEIGYQQLCT